MLIFIDKSAFFSKSSSQRGEDRGGKYLKRVITGKDKDGSPQYRYIRTKEELESYEKLHGKDKKDDTKETHEKQKKEHHKIKQALEGKKEEHTEAEDKKKLYILDTKREKENYSRDKSKEKVKKAIYVQ